MASSAATHQIFQSAVAVSQLLIPILADGEILLFS